MVYANPQGFKNLEGFLCFVIPTPPWRGINLNIVDSALNAELQKRYHLKLSEEYTLHSE